MSFGLVGYKRGMTSYFLENGHIIPITVIEFFEHTIVESKVLEKHIQFQFSVGFKKNLKKPYLCHLKKANIEISSGLYAFYYPLEERFKVLKIGDLLNMSILTDLKKVDVSGVSLGKGFSGVIKRYHFSRQPTSHGNSKSHRVPGSIGQRQTPGRVFKGKKMPGRHGCFKRTVKNLLVIGSDKHFLLVKGSTPGCINSLVFVKKSLTK